MAAQGGVDRDALERQLSSLVDARLLDPLEILLVEGPSRPGRDDATPATDDLLELLRRRAADQARVWAEQLLGPDDRQAKHVLARLIGALYPSDRPFDPPPDWWRTPLGKVTGRRLGHPSVQAVSYAVAGTMLGITRQGVHDLIRRGKLARHPDGGVTVESVRDRLAAAP